ncbi:coiled-coil domain-containing protein 57 [Pseudopipra pipra]|uniref:coiled-coil domain-containing protein 57 n=1 Tax=Pseudopipra pipra TaxID=415032 RepID=UPI003139BD08
MDWLSRGPEEQDLSCGLQRMNGLLQWSERSASSREAPAGCSGTEAEGELAVPPGAKAERKGRGRAPPTDDGGRCPPRTRARPSARPSPPQLPGDAATSVSGGTGRFVPGGAGLRLDCSIRRHCGRTAFRRAAEADISPIRPLCEGAEVPINLLFPYVLKYKQQLSLGAEQEWILEQGKMQTELNWQHLCENAERNRYQKSEDLTQSLFSSREEIFQYDDKISLCKDIPTLEIKKLQKQNASLRAAIAQMRKEMESLDEQMLSSLPLTENRQLVEQGSVSTNKISTATTLSNIKVSSIKLDCIVNPDTEKGPEPKVLEEKIVDRGQQLPDVGPGVELQYGVKHALQGMQNKLKEAARKISILNQEKRQLIEMGNRLRAELEMVLKEGLWHPVGSKHCTVCIASGSLLPRELVKRTQCQLSALKHLQHKLTTQKLQYARQQHPSRFSSLVACPGLKEEEAPSNCGEEIELPSSEVQLDFSIENHGPEQQKANASSKIVQSQPLRQSPSQVQQVQLSSSRAYKFCQGVWQTLEMGSSLSILSPQKNSNQAVELEVIHSTKQSEESQQNVKAKDKLEVPAGDLTVRGTRLEVQQKLKSRNLSCAHPLKPKISSNMAKIRNYNIKD